MTVGVASVAVLPALAKTVGLSDDNATPTALDPADARLVQIHRSATDLRAFVDRDDVSGEDADAACDKFGDMRVEAFDLRATTPAGALASLQLAREEFNRYYIEEPGDDADWLDGFTLRMIDSAIGVLRPMVEGVARV